MTTLKKKKDLKLNNLPLHLNNLEKKGQANLENYENMADMNRSSCL